MEQNQDKESDKRIKATMKKSGTIISYNNNIICNPNYAKDQCYHDRTKSSQCCAKLEHVPCHYRLS
jgi:hypothetical protein